MSSVRVPGSLRSAGRSRHDQAKPAAPRKESKAATLATAALLTAAGSVGMAIAQGTLPPVSVEATQAKKKAKAAPAPKSGEATKQPEQPSSEAPKNVNPYADPNAAYKVDKSASGKLTEPLVNTPRTVTALPKEVVEDKGARDLRELALLVQGLTI